MPIENFEVRIPEGKVSPELIEKHPEVYKALNIFWGSEDMLAYLSKIMQSDRIDRKGFSFTVFKDFTYCLAYHTLLFPSKNDQFNFKVA